MWFLSPGGVSGEPGRAGPGPEQEERDGVQPAGPPADQPAGQLTQDQTAQLPVHPHRE